jgi:hypothetical protein
MRNDKKRINNRRIGWRSLCDVYYCDDCREKITSYQIICKKCGKQCCCKCCDFIRLISDRGTFAEGYFEELCLCHQCYSNFFCECKKMIKTWVSEKF